MDMPMGQPNGDISFIEVLSFQMTLVCVWLTELTSREMKFKGIIKTSTDQMWCYTPVHTTLGETEEGKLFVWRHRDRSRFSDR